MGFIIAVLLFYVIPLKLHGYLLTGRKSSRYKFYFRFQKSVLNALLTVI